MASTYSSKLRVELVAPGEQNDTWGSSLNGALQHLEHGIAGRAAVTHDNSASYSLTSNNGSDDEARNMILHVTGTLTAARNLVCPTVSKLYVVKNATTGGFAITVKTSGGSGISVPNGVTMILFCDGTNVVNALDYVSGLRVGSGIIYLNDSSNAKMTTGLTLNQGAADDEIVALKSSDIAHGVTDLTETDTFAFVSKIDASGGAAVVGLSQGTTSMAIEGVSSAQDTTKATGAAGAVAIRAFLKSGTTRANLDANNNLLVIQSSSTTRFIFDADGDAHQDVGTSWTNFDAHNDMALLDATSALLQRDPGGLRKAFSETFLKENRKKLRDLKIVTFNKDGHHFINWSRFHMLHMGATRFLGDQLAALQAQMKRLERAK